MKISVNTFKEAIKSHRKERFGLCMCCRGVAGVLFFAARAQKDHYGLRKTCRPYRGGSHLRIWESKPVPQHPEGASAKRRKETKERTLHPVGFLGPPMSKV